MGWNQKADDADSITPGEGNDNPLQYSFLENSMDGEPGGLQFMVLQRVRHDWAHTQSHYLTTNQSEERPRADHALLEPLL